jgi:hypothetical protein
MGRFGGSGASVGGAVGPVSASSEPGAAGVSGGVEPADPLSSAGSSSRVAAGGGSADAPGSGTGSDGPGASTG